MRPGRGPAGEEHRIQTKRPRPGLLTLAAACAVAAVAAALLPAPAAAAVPETFHGAVAQQQLSDDDVERLRRGSVGSMRFIVSWSALEPERGRYNFREADKFMIATAGSGVAPLPFIFGTPGWADEDVGMGELIMSSEGQEAWQEVLAALALRYGPDGYFWPVVGLEGGVEAWQLGNEPNLYSFWGGEPSPSGYALMLRLGAEALHSIDPDAEVVMAGLPPGTRGPDGWEFLDDLLDIGGVGEDFDYIAPHPYSRDLAGVRHKLDRFRNVLADHGLADKRMLITEVGWMAGGPEGHPLRRSKQGQARVLSRLYARLAAGRERWGVDGVYWFAWRDRARERGICSFCSRSGLLDSRGRRKPAWIAFRESARSLRR